MPPQPPSRREIIQKLAKTIDDIMEDNIRNTKKLNIVLNKYWSYFLKILTLKWPLVTSTWMNLL